MRRGYAGVQVNTFLPLVAVIEDDPAARKAIGRVLRAGGFETIMYASAEDFLGARPARAPVCLVLDIKLGGISGVELQRRLRTEGSSLPVIVVTASEDHDIREACYQHGCAAFLQKPAEGRVLIGLIGSLVSGHG